MKTFASSGIVRTVAVAASLVVAELPARAELLEKTKNVGGTTVSYKVVLPNGHDPAKTYPAIIALGGGPQTMNTVDNVLNRSLRAEADRAAALAPACHPQILRPEARSRRGQAANASQ